MAEHEPMVEVFIYETRQFLEQLEQLALASEEAGSFAPDDVNEIFRAMHTIKGSSAMMMLDEISQLAHAVEDIFFYIRELHPSKVDVSGITDIVLTAADFMRSEIDVLDDGGKPSESSQEMRDSTHAFLREMKLANGDDPDVDLRKANQPQKKKPVPKQFYIGAAKQEEPASGGKLHVFEATLFFDQGSGMLEVRAFTAVNTLKDKMAEIYFQPEKLLEDDSAPAEIEEKGLRLYFTTEMDEAKARDELAKTSFLTGIELKELASTAECAYWPSLEEQAKEQAANAEPIVPQVPQAGPSRAAQEAEELASVPPAAKKRQSHHEGHESQVISVRVDKLDRLMDLVGELVIAESMVVQNPELMRLPMESFENFQKSSRQLSKISSELQDSVMSLRMVPLDGTFKKMNRIVRDMTKKLNKKARLVLRGEDTEVDKTVSDRIGDPLMHIIRNSVDHGIEMPADRVAAGKSDTGTVTLSAENVGGEVVLRIADDGGGLNRDRILARARERHLFTKPETELTDSEIYHFIFAPGFSTKEQVTEFSGRGVGMDVVVSNIRELGGSVSVDSTPGKGSTTIIRIPLTLAIIDGMSVAAGKSSFTVPIASIRRSFRPEPGDVFRDAEGREMLLEDGRCCPVVRLHRLYHIQDAEEDVEKGVVMLLETRSGGLFAVYADQLMGVQEIVVKPVPKFISNIMDTTGISGCTLLGNGNISLILDADKLGKLIG